MTADQPNSRFRHLFVVVRYDGDQSLDNAVSLVSAWSQRGDADGEAARLNEIASEGSTYRVHMTRLKGD